MQSQIWLKQMATSLPHTDRRMKDDRKTASNAVKSNFYSPNYRQNMINSEILTIKNKKKK